MKKTFGLVVALALVTLAMLPGAAPADLVCSSCSIQYRTSTYTAQGATCQGAKDKLDDLAGPEMTATCSGPNQIPCQPQLVIDVSCFTNAAGKKQVSGHFTYGCATCQDTSGGGTN
jgi:hypothetical protein